MAHQQPKRLNSLRPRRCWAWVLSTGGQGFGAIIFLALRKRALEKLHQIFFNSCGAAQLPPLLPHGVSVSRGEYTDG